MFEIIPQNFSILPGDRQRFKVRAINLSAMWQLLGNATIAANGDLTPTITTNTFAGYSVLQLKSGIGSLEFTLDANCLPPVGAGSYFSSNLFDADSSVLLAWKIDPNTGNLTFENESGVIFTMAYTPAVGDVLKLEASGSVWRGYLNGIEKVSHIPSTGIDYPCNYNAVLHSPLPASAKIPGPRLIGDWTSIADADWTAITHGTLSSLTGKEIEYTAGTVPGNYELLAKFAASNFQQAKAAITIPPLALAMPETIEVYPAQTIRLITNYDAAQSNLVTWTALDGGTLAGNEFTPLSAPGNYRVRASSGTQRAIVTITVPRLIQAATDEPLTSLEALPRGQSVKLVTNMTSPAWAVDVGTITPGAGGTAIFAVPNQSGVARITVTSGGIPTTIVVELAEVFPVDPTFSYSVELAKTIVASRTEDDKPYGRVKSARNQYTRRFELKFEDSEQELSTVEAFWASHFPERICIFWDKLRDEKVPVLFDSNIKYEPTSDCEVGFSFRLVEA